MRDSSLLLFATGSLPLQVVLDIVSTDTVAKGDEKAPQYKPAIVGSGRKVMVPPFIATGWQLENNSPISLWKSKTASLDVLT